MENKLSQINPAPPDTAFSKDKTLTDECEITVNGKSYIKRTYEDGCAELLRYDNERVKWVCSCFKALEDPNKAQQIRDAVRNNFDLNK